MAADSELDEKLFKTPYLFFGDMLNFYIFRLGKNLTSKQLCLTEGRLPEIINHSALST